MAGKAKALGFNHVALEVGDIDEALAFYGSLFELRLRGRGARMAFVDMGDQFLALSAGRTQPSDSHRHVGLVVDDVEAVRTALAGTTATILPGRGLDFLDPWGNHFQVVAYEEIQFLKAPEVLRVLGADGLRKTDAARARAPCEGDRPRLAASRTERDDVVCPQCCVTCDDRQPLESRLRDQEPIEGISVVQGECPASHACSWVIASFSNRSRSSWSRISSIPLIFPIPDLIESSRAVTALTATRFSGSAIADLA